MEQNISLILEEAARANHYRAYLGQNPKDAERGRKLSLKWQTDKEYREKMLEKQRQSGFRTYPTDFHKRQV